MCSYPPPPLPPPVVAQTSLPTSVPPALAPSSSRSCFHRSTIVPAIDSYHHRYYRYHRFSLRNYHTTRPSPLVIDDTSIITSFMTTRHRPTTTLRHINANATRPFTSPPTLRLTSPTQTSSWDIIPAHPLSLKSNTRPTVPPAYHRQSTLTSDLRGLCSFRSPSFPILP